MATHTLIKNNYETCDEKANIIDVNEQIYLSVTTEEVELRYVRLTHDPNFEAPHVDYLMVKDMALDDLVKMRNTLTKVIREVKVNNKRKLLTGPTYYG